MAEQLPHYSDPRLVRELLGQTQVDFSLMTVSVRLPLQWFFMSKTL